MSRTYREDTDKTVKKLRRLRDHNIVVSRRKAEVAYEERNMDLYNKFVTLFNRDHKKR